jgi:nicotinamidase-related amidase
MTANVEGYSSELLASYAASGFTAGHGEKKGGYPFGDKPALLVIDVCNAYLTEGSPLYGKDRFQKALVSCEKTISLCREKGIPVIFSRVGSSLNRFLDFPLNFQADLVVGGLSRPRSRWRQLVQIQAAQSAMCFRRGERPRGLSH